MKLILDTKSFTEAVAWVAKALDTKSDKSYIALVVDADGNGHLSHTNGLSYIKSELRVNSITLDDGEDTVKLALDAAYVKRLASTLKNFDEPLTFSKAKNARASLAVKRPGENYTIPLVDASIGREPAYEIVGSVSDGEFFDSLTKLAKLTDPINAGAIPVVGTVDLKLDKEEETITLMATDRYALGEIVIPFSPSADAEFYGNAVNLLLPEERASLIAPSKGLVDTVELIHEAKSSKFGYRFPDGRIVLFALSAAEPLAYAVIKERSAGADISALLSANDLRQAIAAVSSLAYSETSIVLTFLPESQELVVSDVHESNTRVVSLESSEGLEKKTRVQFTRSILNEALIPLSTSRLRMKWKDENSQFLFSPVFDDDSEAENVFLLAIPEQDG